MVKLNGKYNLLTIQEIIKSHTGNKTKRILEMSTWQIDIEAWIFKAENITMKACIYKETYLLSYIGRKGILEVLNSEESKGYKNKI